MLSEIVTPPPAIGADALDGQRPVISEFSIAILSMLCLSMGIGSGLPRDVGLLAGACGALGMLAYALSITRKRKHRRTQAELSQYRMESRLKYHARGLWHSYSSSFAARPEPDRD